MFRELFNVMVRAAVAASFTVAVLEKITSPVLVLEAAATARRVTLRFASSVSYTHLTLPTNREV